mmetsp:Transcript_14621/g.22858  ORF Transcript_14621/g.22858 Transcript_14621/m.22858 type:complete len:108 (-) Transcript_14621:267-590(-)
MLSDYQQPPRGLATILLESSTAVMTLVEKNKENNKNITLELSEELSSTTNEPTLSSILRQVMEILEDIKEQSTDERISKAEIVTNETNPRSPINNDEAFPDTQRSNT